MMVKKKLRKAASLQEIFSNPNEENLNQLLSLPEEKPKKLINEDSFNPPMKNLNRSKLKNQSREVENLIQSYINEFNKEKTPLVNNFPRKENSANFQTSKLKLVKKRASLAESKFNFPKNRNSLANLNPLRFNINNVIENDQTKTLDNNLNSNNSLQNLNSKGIVTNVFENDSDNQTYETSENFVSRLKNSPPKNNQLNVISVRKQKSIYINKLKENYRKLFKIDKVDDSLSDMEELEYMIDMNSNFIILPENRFIHYWEYLIIFITIYSLILTPFSIAFNLNFPLPLKTVELLFDIIFMIDLILSFFIATYDFEERLIMNHKLLVKNYLSGWFLMDGISSIPGNTIANYIQSGGESFIKQNYFVFSILRLTKIFKLVKLAGEEESIGGSKGKIKLLEELNLRSGVQRLIHFLFGFLIFSHIIACIWIYVGNLKNRSWITIYVDNELNIDVYVCSIYFIWSSIFSIGYGDILSVNLYERVFNILLMSLGVFIYTFAVSSVSSIVSTYDAITERYFRNLEMVEELRKNCYELSDDLYEKIVKFLKFNYKVNKTEKFSFVVDLPNNLRNEFIFSVYARIISNFSFFKYSKKLKNDDFNTKVVLCMRPIRLNKGDLILREGEKVQEMFLINQGILSAELEYDYGSKKIFDLRRNDYFGDIFVLSNKSSPVNIRVKSRYCEIYIIRKSDLLSIKEEFRDIFNEIIKVSLENFKRTQKIIKEFKTQFKFNKPVSSHTVTPRYVEEKKENRESILKQITQRKSTEKKIQKVKVLEIESENDLIEEKKSQNERNQDKLQFKTEKFSPLSSKGVSNDEFNNNVRKSNYLKTLKNLEYDLPDFRVTKFKDSEVIQTLKENNLNFGIKNKIKESMTEFLTKTEQKSREVSPKALNITSLNNLNFNLYFDKANRFSEVINKTELKIQLSNQITYKGEGKRSSSPFSVCHKCSKKLSFSPLPEYVDFPSDKLSVKKKKSSFNLQMEKMKSEKTFDANSYSDQGKSLKRSKTINKNNKSKSPFSIRRQDTNFKVIQNKPLIFKKKTFVEIQSSKFAEKKHNEMISNLEQHVDENLKIKVNPFSFIHQQFNKIDRQMAIEQKKEMNKLIDKLEDIYEFFTLLTKPI